MNPLRPATAARSFSLVGLIVLLLVATPSSAATVTSAASGPWTSPSTWGGGVVPAPADDVVVAAGHTVTVAVADSPTVNSLAINAGQTTTANATLQVAGTLAVTTSITLTGGSQQATAPSGTATLSVGGAVTAAELNVFGGAGTTVGPGGTAAVNLTATSAIVTISGNVALAPGGNSTYPGGAPSIAFSAAGTLDVRGHVSNQGTITLGAGLFKHGGDYSGTGTLNSSSGTLRLDGTDFQMWQGSSFTFQNLTITNSSANPSFASGAAEIWADVTVNGTLALQGGVLSVIGSVTVASPSVIQRTSGHVHGQINMPMPASQAVVFPLGTAVHYMPLTITSPTAGTLFARSREYAQPESGQASLQGHWELWSSDIPTLQQIVFGYEAAQVMGSEASYVAGRTESYGVPWERYPTTVNTAVHTATISGAITPNGSWTLAEPWAVTTATNFSARIASGAGNPRINTPFAVVLDAKDGSGNPAVFSSSMSVSVAPGASPTPTGTLKDEWGSLPPLYFYTPEWETSATLDGLLYDVAESITIVLTDTGSTPRFSPITLNVTFDPPAAALVVSTTAPEGDGSLAHAIATANNGGCSSTPCPISFNLPPAQQSTDGTWKIVMPAMIAESQDADSYLSSSSTIPYANVAVIIDATTQPGYAGTPVVELDGGGAWSGIELYGGASTIRGLAIHNADTGLYLGGTGGHVIEGCYIGLSATGAVTAPGTMYEGIWIDSPGNFIGGPTAQQRNVIADAWSTGIYVSSYMAGNSIRGNYVGTNPAGSAAIGNGTGIYLESYGNIIGGILAGEGNLVAGSADYGLLLVQPMYAASGPIASNVDAAVAATPNQVQGNTFGRSTGGSDLLNGSGAIGVIGGGHDYVLVGGPAAGQGNVIAHGSAHGVAMGQGVSGVVVSGNTYAGAGLPIDINGDYAPLANDPGDADVNMIECPVSGPCVMANQGQNTPEIITATQVGTTLEAVVKVDSSAVTATQSIRVELYAGDAVSKTLISSACFNTNFVNNLTVFAANSPTTAGSQVLATATSYTTAGCQPTDGLGNTTIGDGTSEFSAPATVTACNAPVVTITPPAPKLCAGGSVVLTASVSGGSGTYSSYQWFNGATPISGANALTYTATAAGTYSFTATDNTGCPGSATVTVTQNPALSVAIAASGPTTFCAGGSVTLSANATGGSGTVSTYAWYNGTAPISGATGPTLAVNTGGTYKVVITDSAGCSAEATQPVTVNAKPAASVNAGGPTTFCSGGSVTLTAAGSGGAGGGYTYQWLNGGSPISGANASTLNVTASGSYSVVVSDANCPSAPSSPVTVTVNPTPVVNITPSGPTTFCEGGSVTLTATAGSSYQWFKDGTLISTATSQTLLVTASGGYSVTVTDGAGCSGTSGTVSVSVTAAPQPVISGPASTCSGSSVTLDAGAGYSTYLWSNGATTQTITVAPTATTSYTVTVTNANGCSKTSAPHTVTVAAAPSVTITGPASVCAGTPFTLDAGAGFDTYFWSNGATSRTITVSQTAATTYSVQVTLGGCAAAASKLVSVTPAPDATISTAASVDPQTSRNYASASAQTGASYTWSITNGTITSGHGTNAVLFDAGASGDLTLTLTVTIGDCSATRTVTVAINNLVSDLSVRMTAPAEVRSASSFAYTIDIRNDGPSPASNAVLTASLPAGVTVGSATGVWPCATSGLSVTCQSPSVPVGPVGTITLNVTAPGSAGTLAASALITSGTTDNNGANNTSGATTEVVGAQASCPTVAPSLVSPANNATGVTSPVTFTWTAVEGATSYEVWISSGAPQLLGTTGTTSLTGPVPSGALTWYVVARAGDACGSVTSESRQLTVAPANNCPTAAPQLTAPAAGSTTSSPVTFTWSSVANATGYRVLIRVNGEAILQDLGTTTSALTLSAPVPAGSIEAFVEAIYAGCPAVRSTGVTFTVAAPDPCADRQIATLNSPANDAVVNSSLVTFVWTAAEGADGYRLWVSVDEGTPQVLGSTEGQTSVQVALGRGTMTWWIEALYDGCASTESARRKFTIPPATDCGTALADPILPLNGAVVPNSDVTFTWANVPSAVEYELWLSLGEGTPTLFGETDGATTSLTSRWMPTGNMKWFVRARVDRCPARDSASASFTSQTPPSCETNQRPILVFPADGERLTSPTNLRWSTPQGATRFEILVDRGHGPVVAATSTGSSAENVILPTGRVKWFARAYFGEGCSALDSAEQSIEVLPPPAVCQDLLPPIVSAPGQISSGVSFRIHWTPIPGATSYNLLIASRPDFGDAQVVTVSSPEYQLTRENRTASNTAVYVRARAIDSRCNPASFGPYGPTSAIFILPFGSAETGSLASESTIVKSSITLGAELAGQTFVASAAESWITITPSSGMVPAGGITLEVTADTRGLPLGTTIGGVTVTLTSPGSAGSVASHGTTTVTTPITVNLVTPVTPTAKSGPPPDALIIPAVAHADGVNAKFQSDVRVTNTSPQLMKYLITFTPSGDGIGSGRQTTLSIEPGRTIALDDVLKSWFGTGSVSTTGTLEIRPQTQAFAATSSATVKGLANLATFASSRTFNLAANGSFGQHIPAIPFANFIGKAASAQASVLSLQQIAQSSQYRTNLGLVEASGNPASLLVSVFGKSGDKLTSFTVDLKGGQHTQLNSFLAQRGITSLDDGRVEVAVTSGLGKVTAYASVLDNKTSDPLLVTPVSLSEAGDTKWVVPGVADLNNGFANWQTDLRIFNGESEPVETTVSFYSQNGGAPKTATLTIPAGQVRQLDRALSTLFSTANDGGAIHLATSKASRIVATARTYNLTGTGGTYGQFISAVTQGETAGVGTRPLQLLQVEESERFRSNIGLAETSGKPVKVSLSVIPPDAKLTAFIEVDLAPNEFRQISSLLKTVGLTNTHNARVTVRAIEGAGRVTAYASVVDLLTQDPTYIPAQ